MTDNNPDLDDYRQALEKLSWPKFADPPQPGPFVLAVEGPNGAGKTTLCRAMAEKMGAAQCLGTDAAWFGPAFKTRMIRDAPWYSSAMFFLSGCCEQMRVLQHRADPLILMDRCLWSTFAVHGADSPQRLEKLIAMIQPVASELPIPHATLVLEASFATCQARIARKEGEARALDQLTANVRFHTREREFYRWLSSRIPNFIFLDVNEDTAERVTEKAISSFHRHRC